MLVTRSQRECFYQGNDREKPQRGKLLQMLLVAKVSIPCTLGGRKLLACLCERLRVSRGLRASPLLSPGPGSQAPGQSCTHRSCCTPQGPGEGTSASAPTSLCISERALMLQHVENFTRGLLKKLLFGYT